MVGSNGDGLTILLLDRTRELRQLWRKAPSISLRRGHAGCVPERLQCRTLQCEIARGVSARRRNACVPKLITNRDQIDTSLEHPDGAGMPQEMWPHLGGEARIGLVNGMSMLSENVIDAVASKTVAT